MPLAKVMLKEPKAEVLVITRRLQVRSMLSQSQGMLRMIAQHARHNLMLCCEVVQGNSRSFSPIRGVRQRLAYLARNVAQDDSDCGWRIVS